MQESLELKVAVTIEASFDSYSFVEQWVKNLRKQMARTEQVATEVLSRTDSH